MKNVTFNHDERGFFDAILLNGEAVLKTRGNLAVTEGTVIVYEKAFKDGGNIPHLLDVIDNLVNDEPYKARLAFSCGYLCAKVLSPIRDNAVKLMYLGKEEKASLEAERVYRCAPAGASESKYLMPFFVLGTFSYVETLDEEECEKILEEITKKALSGRIGS